MTRTKTDGRADKVGGIGLDPMLGRARVIDEAWPDMGLRVAIAFARTHHAVAYDVQMPDTVAVVKQRCTAERPAIENAGPQRVAAKQG